MSDTKIGNYVLQLGSDTLGRGDDVLGKRLAISFLTLLPESEVLPKAILMFNRGVFHAVQDSETLEVLKEMESAGTTILICGTCVDYFGIADKIGVGKVSNMVEITKSMLEAGKVIPV
ncbi:sulfurtransferase-like selenium metabolism protein YedF [bacterium]|nr:sulfurtransferase-like selenium metabolism protein YedF [bacterium]